MRPVLHRAPHFPVPCREESKERRNARWHTTLLAKSSVFTPWFRLMRKRGCERLRQAPVLWQKDARMGMAVDDFRPPIAGFQRNQWCTFSFLPQQRFSYKAQGK